MKHYKVRYIDRYSNGQIKETEITGNYTRAQVIDFLGLNEPDVSWYDIVEVTKA